MTSRPVPSGVATGVGSLPGVDIDDAVGTVFDALPDLPHLPELPGLGPGADLVGRSAAALTDLHVDLQPAGWRLVARPGVDERRAADLLERDLDALVRVGEGFRGPFKVQLAGPWTLAASVELPRGGRVLVDAGAVRDVADSLADTVVGHLADVARRLPGAELVLQLDEPALTAVVAGTIPSESGFGRIAAVDPVLVRATLGRVVSAAGVPVVVHCCAVDAPLALMHEAGAAAVSFDLTLGRPDLDVVGALIEQGLRLWLGVLPTSGPGAAPTVRAVTDPVRRLWHDLGFAPEQLPETIAVTPACGLAGASEGWARTALALAVRAARALVEAPEGMSA